LKKNPILLTMLFLFSSCSLLLKNVYGYKEIKEFDQKEYDKFIAEIKQSYPVNDKVSTYNEFYNYIALGKDSIQRKDLSQPIQILYFDRDSLVSFHANCYAKGQLSGLDWNYENRFSIFPPHSAKNPEDFNSIRFKKINEIFQFNDKLKKYTIIIFWTRMFEKISKDAIYLVINNLKTNKVKDAQIILINTDHFFFKENQF